MTGIILIWAFIAFVCVIFGIVFTFCDECASYEKLSTAFLLVSGLLLFSCILLLTGSYHGIGSTMSEIQIQQEENTE